MKFTLDWLKDYLDTDADLTTITDTLTRIGLELEGVHNPADALRDFVIVDVLEAVPHPDADKLRVCQVSDGKTTDQIVCGAPNARSGMKAVLGRPGTYVPGADITLKVSKIRGVESRGMMCSGAELNLGDDHEGILDLPDDAVAGTSYADYAGLDDPVIEIAITPNRQDCLGVYGIARDLAAAGLGTLKTPDLPNIAASTQSPLQPEISPDAMESGACTGFYGRYFEGVTNGESPDWVQRRLQAVGQQPISALVDVTNYISLSFARPLHVYDADKLTGNPVARLAVEGETFVALDGKTYTARGGETVIADDAAVLGFGGIIGGEASGCTASTKNVLLECALFDPIATATTGRKHQIDTDARYRFERGVDAEFVEPGLALASQLILDWCGGKASGVVAAGKAAWDAPVIGFRPARVAELGGFDVTAQDCKAILERLGFTVNGTADRFDVTVPSWRVDIEGEADIVEEVLRITGYDNVPSVDLPPLDRSFQPTLSLAQRRSRSARRALAVQGMHEVVTWSMLTEDAARHFGGGGADLEVANPISNLLAVMRPTPLPNLLEAAKRNQDRGAGATALFEVGPAYENDTPAGQRLVASGVRSGVSDRHWAETARSVDVFDAKADALAALAAAGAPVDNLQVYGDAGFGAGADGAGGASNGGDVFHPGRSGTLRLGPKTILARFGEFHPKTLKAFDIDGRAVGFEVYLDQIPERKRAASRGAMDVTNLQRVSRDFAFVIKADVAVQGLVRAIRGADKTFIRDIAVFDVYQGKGIADDEKSIGICVTLEPKSETFSEADLEALSEKIVAAGAKAVGARLR